MFYNTHLPEHKDGNNVSALVSLTSSESKRLIAKGVARLPEVSKALKNGLVIIGRGSTNAFIAEEILGISIKAKTDEYCRGLIVGGELRTNTKTAAERTIGNDFVLRHGKVDSSTPQGVIKEFGPDDIFIKGANAVDSTGDAAVLAAGADGGTIGWALLPVTARSAHLIVAVGLEKMIPSVALACQKCGVLRFKYSTGLPCALIPLVNGKVVTEIQAFEVLAGVTATHVASGGIGGSEGTVVLTLEGNVAAIERALEFVKAVKGEPPVAAPEKSTPPAANFNYDPIALRKSMNR
jgi:hypothetical protein